MSAPMLIQCHCRSTGIELHGQPAARANCHCQSCREFYGTAVLSATAWPAESVRLTGGQSVSFKHPAKEMSKTFCATCGDTLFGTNRLGMRIVLNGMAARAAGGSLPAELSPTMHLFYRHRVIDVADSLAKYLDGWDGPEYGAPGADTRGA